MNVEENNKTLGILHLVYGGFHGLITLAFMVFLVPLFRGISQNPGRGEDAVGVALVAVIFAMVAFFWLLFTIPSLVAGYGLLKRRSWAKVWAMIAGGIAGMSFPLGTALCVYTFWFMLSGGGKELYDPPGTHRNVWHQPGALHGAPPPPPPGWSQRPREPQHTYAPPFEPPNWRGD